MQPSHPTATLSSAVTLSFFPSQSGGRIITLEGRGFGLVQNVSMAVRGIGREHTVGVLARHGPVVQQGCVPAARSRAAGASASGWAGALVARGSDLLTLLLSAL